MEDVSPGMWLRKDDLDDIESIVPGLSVKDHGFVLISFYFQMLCQ